MNITIDLNDREFKYFGSKEVIESTLKNMVPIDHKAFRSEHIKDINDILDLIEDDDDIIDITLIKDTLITYNIIVLHESEYIVNKIYHDHFKLLLHDIVKEGYDTLTASHIAIIQILMENSNIQILMENSSECDNDYYYKDATMYLYHKFFHTYAESLMDSKRIREILNRRHETSIILS